MKRKGKRKGGGGLLGQEDPGGSRTGMCKGPGVEVGGAGIIQDLRIQVWLKGKEGIDKREKWKCRWGKICEVCRAVCAFHSAPQV